jgi:large subunit ribosomal protein L9
LANLVITIPVKATEEGKLFGSIGTSIIARAVQEADHDVKKAEINLPQGPLRQIGEYDISLLLHTDVSVIIKVKVVPVE